MSDYDKEALRYIDAIKKDGQPNGLNLSMECQKILYTMIVHQLKYGLVSTVEVHEYYPKETYMSVVVNTVHLYYKGIVDRYSLDNKFMYYVKKVAEEVPCR